MNVFKLLPYIGGVICFISSHAFINTHRGTFYSQSFFTIYFYGMLQCKSAVVKLAVSLEGQSCALYSTQCRCAAETGGEWEKWAAKEKREIRVQWKWSDGRCGVGKRERMQEWKDGGKLEKRGNTGVRREDGVKCCSNTEPPKREGGELR